MLTRLLSFTLCIVIPFITFAQVDLTKGLVAYYPFSGNANDASGNGNNPIFNNATLTSDYYGNANSAYHFNGIDNYMEIPNNASLNFGTQMSLCVWVKPTGFYTGPCYNNMIISKEIQDYVPGNYSLRFTDAVTGCTSNADTMNEVFYGPDGGIGSQSPVQLNQWYNIVFTSDGATTKLYINCKLVSSQSITATSYTNSYDLFFGHLDAAAYPYWLNGDLDEVRIYNRALNANEVEAYSGICKEVNPCSNWLKTAGIDPGVQIGDLDISGNKITVEALFNRTDSYDPSFYGGDIVSKHTDPTDVNYLLRSTRAEITTTTGWHGTPDVCDFQLNKTYHVAMVYDGSTLKFYRNGFLMSETSCTGNLVLNNWITRIGSTAAPPDMNPSDFHGYINEVRIWNIARSQNEIRSFITQALPNPASQNGLLAYYTFDDLKNKQGNPQWDGSLLNDAVINQTNPQCTFVADSCNTIQTSVTASFTAPDTVCINTPVNFINTSQNASNYYWNFCAADFNTTPVGSNLGNPGNTLSAPVFMDYILDDNGNYYGFVSNYNGGHLIRLNYGNSLLNSPTAEDLGNLGVIPSYAEGIQVKKQNGKCYAFIVSAGDAFGTNSQLIRIDFGNSFANSPSAISLGNIGGLNFPHDLFITADNNNFYGFTVNINDNTITRFDFGNDLSNQPTGINLGNIGNLNYPCGFSFVNSNGTWYAFITNRNSNTVSRLNFGSSLLNTPTGVNIGNPGNFLNRPRDISIFESCSGIVGLIVNEEDEQTGTIVKLNFGTDITSIPTATNLGNVGGITFPHSISKFFLEGNDIYSFIPNVTTSTLTRIRYVGCNSSSIPSSTQQTPPAVTYSQPGVYNVNLLVDIGLPTETSFCKQIVVKDCDNPCDSFKVNAGKDISVCYGSTTQLTASGATIYNWNMSTALSDTTIANPIASPSVTTLFIVTGYDSTGTCSDKDTVKVSVLPLPVTFAGNDTTICGDGLGQLHASGADIYHWSPVTGLSNPNIASPVVSPPSTTIYYVLGTDNNGCKKTDSVKVIKQDDPVFTVNPTDSSICSGQTITLTAAGGDIYAWSPSQSVSNPSSANTTANPSVTTNYTVIIYDSTCKSSKTLNSTITVKPSPDVNIIKSNDIDCSNLQAQLNATGGISYSWTPSTYIDDTQIANPVVNPPSDTKYSVTVIGSDNCTAQASVLVNSTLGNMGFYVANAFTPNGDGLNDCFGIRYWGLPASFDMIVYDKWGVPVYHSNNISECWDGTYKGKKQGSGTYVYMITATSVCGQDKVFRKGTVVLIR